MDKLEINDKIAGIYSRVKEKIIRTSAIKSGDRILAAVSGGPDSMAMMYMLHSLSKEIGFEFGVGHVNHCLRGAESDGDADFVKEITSLLGLRLHSVRVDANAYRIENRLSPEEAAREVRFSFLYRTLNESGYTKIATAHNSDDNAELVLMNILRGTGMDGLEGMRMVVPETKIIRPFIHLYRRDIEYFIENSDIPFRIDSSNEDEHFLRNRIRKNLFPHIENRFNGKIKEALNRLSDIVAVENEFMEIEAEKIFPEAATIKSPRLIQIEASAILSMHPAMSRRILRIAIKKLKGDLKRISHIHIDDIISLASRDYDCELHIPGRIRALKKNGLICLRKEDQYLRFSASTIEDYSYYIDYLTDLPLEMDIPEAGIKLIISEAKEGLPEKSFLQGSDKIYVDKDSLSLPLIIRNARQGDRFKPMGMNGTKTAMRFLMDLKIPESERKTQPILESGGEILWIIGKRLAEKLKIKGHIERMILIEAIHTK